MSAEDSCFLRPCGLSRFLPRSLHFSVVTVGGFVLFFLTQKSNLSANQEAFFFFLNHCFLLYFLLVLRPKELRQFSAFKFVIYDKKKQHLAYKYKYIGQ